MANLVIVESPAKAKTIEEFLSEYNSLKNEANIIEEIRIDDVNYRLAMYESDCLKAIEQDPQTYNFQLEVIKDTSLYYNLSCSETIDVTFPSKQKSVGSIHPITKIIDDVNELKRIKQDKLINPKTIPIVIKNCIMDNVLSGSIIRIDGDINE